MEIRVLQREEIITASGLSRYVFDTCLRNRMEYQQTLVFVEEYISEENLTKLYEEGKLLLWGTFEGAQMVAVSGMQSDGMITMLYVLPQCQNRGYGGKMLNAMRLYAKNACGFEKVIVNANPAGTSYFFAKKGFSNLNVDQDLRAPFVPMYAMSKDIDGYEIRKISKKWILLALAGCILFSTLVGSLYMLFYIF